MGNYARPNIHIKEAWLHGHLLQLPRLRKQLLQLRLPGACLHQALFRGQQPAARGSRLVTRGVGAARRRLCRRARRPLGLQRRLQPPQLIPRRCCSLPTRELSVHSFTVS